MSGEPTALGQWGHWSGAQPAFDHRLCVQNGQAAARALLAACQQLRSSTSAIRCLLGQAVQGLSTDRTTGCIETITTNEYRHASSFQAGLCWRSMSCHELCSM